MFRKSIGKALSMFSPIDGTAGHGCSFAGVSAIFKKAKPGIVKETNARGLCPNMIFPMLRIRCNRNQRDNFGPKFFRSPSAFCKPMADPRLPFFVQTIGWVHINCREVPLIFETVMFGKRPFGLGVHD